jgi:hypothetical protein
MGWSSKGLKGKKSIPLASMYVGASRGSNAKLGMDESYAKTLQAYERA